MLYRKDRYGNDLSALGFGCMRFTTINGKIDMEKAEKEILRSIDLGVNYFDTAYIYTGSEAAIGEIFERNGVRDKIKIATKLPQYLISNRKAIDKYFNEQLSRLRTDHVDYYLMHMLTDIEAWNKLVALGIKDWIDEKKKSGEIG
ncbi:MAG: aldo/keto reductase, partial [Lachnospiraceae bacterium]|nr:aldo/keto reductase [Lachnospiraceae bacterium]